MALNRERPHLLVLPEDDATRNIGNGFSEQLSGPKQVLNNARGWKQVNEELVETYLAKLKKYGKCQLVLLIDFDDDFPNRLAQFQEVIPECLKNRIYVIGPLTEAETLKKSINKKYAEIGRDLASECEQGRSELWHHAQLIHNQAEVKRLQKAVKSFLFKPSE